MNFEIYCDESSHEALIEKEAHRYIVIGGIWLPADQRTQFKEGLKVIRQAHGIHGEMKWRKLSPAYFDFYKDIIDFFFQSDYIRFRAILIESDKVNNVKFNSNDSELSFYKFYYQLLHHWIFDFNSYDIFLDYKVNHDRKRLPKLCTVLNNANLTSDIRFVQALPSEQSLGVQLADVLTGVVASKFNCQTTGKSKPALIEYIEQAYLQKVIQPTGKWEEKFNIFKINLQGGW
jgi:Protein of unknown function (DUF3800)